MGALVDLLRENRARDKELAEARAFVAAREEGKKAKAALADRYGLSDLSPGARTLVEELARQIAERQASKGRPVKFQSGHVAHLPYRGQPSDPQSLALARANAENSAALVALLREA